MRQTLRTVRGRERDEAREHEGQSADQGCVDFATVHPLPSQIGTRRLRQPPKSTSLVSTVPAVRPGAVW